MKPSGDQPDHRRDRDPRGDRHPVQRDLTHPDAHDDRDRSVAFRNPGDALPPESLCELAHLLANVILRRRRKYHETTCCRPPAERECRATV